MTSTWFFINNSNCGPYGCSSGYCPCSRTCYTLYYTFLLAWIFISQDIIEIIILSELLFTATSKDRINFKLSIVPKLQNEHDSIDFQIYHNPYRYQDQTIKSKDMHLAWDILQYFLIVHIQLHFHTNLSKALNFRTNFYLSNRLILRLIYQVSWWENGPQIFCSKVQISINFFYYFVEIFHVILWRLLL